MTPLATKQEDHLALLRRHGQALAYRGDVLAWLGLVPTARGWAAVTLQARYASVGVWIPQNPPSDAQIQAALPYPFRDRLWTAENKGLKGLQQHLVGAADHEHPHPAEWTRVSVSTAMALFREVLARPLDPEQA